MTQPNNSQEQKETGTSSQTKKWEAENPEIMQEISIDEFQPKGTLTLVLLYFAIVILMWIFMYFVEFAGNDPSILN